MPLLVMRFGMGFWISPDPWFELIIVCQRFSQFKSLVILVIPRESKYPTRDAGTP
jgi:hypothetical protein